MTPDGTVQPFRLQPGRMVSLYDMAFNFYVKGFCWTLHWLWQEETLAATKKGRQSGGLLSTTPGLGAFGSSEPPGFFSSGSSGLTNSEADSSKQVIGYLREHCVTLEMSAARDRIDRLLNRLGPAMSYEDYETELRVLREIIEDDLKGRHFYYYPQGKSALLLSCKEDWKLSYDKFTSARHDIFGALDCYATGHNTACVFHLMRVAEYGLRALARERRVRLSKNRPLEWADWRDMLMAVRKKVEAIANRPRGAARERALNFYQGVLGEFEAFKDAYRNSVMHARERYDEGQARSVMLHVREFMERLSSKIDENSKKQINWSKK